VATVDWLVCQVTDELKVCWLPSLMLAVARSWLLLPSGSAKVAGATFTESATAGVTVRLAVPVIDPEVALEVALIVVVPIALARAEPAALTVAVAGGDEIHVTDCVKFCVLPSVNVPVAVSCSVSPIGKDDGVGVTAILTSAGGPTVTDVLPDTPSYVADTCAAPLPTAVTKPCALTVAMEGWLDCHVTDGLDEVSAC
jgi:hypothetical protein